jgi:D-amino-acid dehydrogenase
MGGTDVTDTIALDDRPQDGPLDVAIIGGGIIALAAAQKLQAAGRRVTVIERHGIAEAASFGNAAAFAFSDILPLAVSGKIRQVPKWLLDPLGPLSIRPSYVLKAAPWLLRFWRAGWPDRIERSITAQGALMRVAAVEMASMLADTGLGFMVREDGSLELYESEAEFAASQPGWRARTDHGIAFEHVRGERMAELQPGLSPRFMSGTFVPGWQNVTDPYDFALALARAVQARGVAFLRGEATAVVPDGDGVTITLANGQSLASAAAVIATGAWSRRLTDQLGDAIPLETERGYNTTLPLGAFDVQRQLVFGGHGFVITPLGDGVRIGGAVEFAGLDLPPNFKRSEAMLAKAARFLPGLKREGGTQWMGFRPSLPDSVPVIGPSRASPRIVYAFGHGHYGLTQSAGTGALVRDMLCGKAPAIDVAPFSAARFR